MKTIKFPINTLIVYTASDINKYLCKVVDYDSSSDCYSIKRIGTFHKGQVEYNTKEFIEDTHVEVTDKFIRLLYA